MNSRYEVTVKILVDSDSEDHADELVTDMMCGTEMMSRMWNVEKAEKQFDHEGE